MTAPPPPTPASGPAAQAGATTRTSEDSKTCFARSIWAYGNDGRSNNVAGLNGEAPRDYIGPEDRAPRTLSRTVGVRRTGVDITPLPWAMRIGRMFCLGLRPRRSSEDQPCVRASMRARACHTLERATRRFLLYSSRSIHDVLCHYKQYSL